MAVSPVSFSKTPQAKDDLFANSVTEDTLGALLDVMGNDLGGGAKALYSLDSGQNINNLLNRDAARTAAASNDYSAQGARIWITNDGKIGYDASALSARLQSLAVGQYFEDSFVYAIQMGNGTLSIATATVRIVGLNDGPKITSVTQAGTVREDQITSISGQVTASDVDNGDHQHYSLPNGGAGIYGSLSVHTGTGAWLYLLNNSASNVQALAQGESHVETFIVRVTDDFGAYVAQDVQVTVTGTNDKPQITSAQQTGAVVEDVSLIASGNVTASDVDNGDHRHFAALDGGTGAYGSLAVNGNTGEWTYTLANGAANVQSLAQGESHIESFTVRVSDDFGAWADQWVKVGVTGSNDGPVAMADWASGSENQSLIIDVLGNDTDVDNGHSFTLQSVSESSGKGSVAISGNKLAFNPGTDFDHLNVGQTAAVVVSYDMTDEHGALSSSAATLVLHGENDTPWITAPLRSDTNEDAAVYTIDLLAGASDVDDGFVLNAADVTEIRGQGGWALDGNVITINPDYFGEGLNDGDFAKLQFNYQVVDEHGAAAAQSLTVNIEGITDAPSLAVVTSAGDSVNEVMLNIASEPAHGERVGLNFAGMPAGARIFDAITGQDVTGGLNNYQGAHDFKLVLAADADANEDLSVTVTGYRPNGSVIGAKVQTVDVSYDVTSDITTVNFSSEDQNTWGNFPSQVNFHEYLPIVGGAPIAWNAATKSWDSAPGEYWHSGKATIVDATINTASLYAAAQTGSKGVLDAAKAVFDSTAHVIDAGVQKVFNDAKTVFAAAEYAFWYVARGVDQAVKDTFKAAQELYSWAQGVYGNAWYAFNVVATGIYNAAHDVYDGFMNYYNSFDPAWRWLNDAPKLVADGIWGAAQWAYGVAYNAWADTKTWFDNTATAAYNWAVGEYNRAAGAIEQAATDTFNTARGEFAKAETKYNDFKAWVFDQAAKVYNEVQKGINDTLAVLGSKVDFNSQLKIEADVFARAGLQVDIKLDLGSVNTDLDYQLTSTTQYNKTTDMLVIKPMMTDVTTGTSVAFDTISPNAKVYIALLYDAGANLDILLDGKLAIDGLTLYDLVPGSDQKINLGATLSPKVAVANLASLFADLGGLAGLDLNPNLDPDKLVLVDLDTTKSGPVDIPFVGTLTDGIVTISVEFPTVETAGTAKAYKPNYYNEGGLVAVDFSEITDSLFNLVTAKLDYSPELRDKVPGLGPLLETQNFDQLVQSALKTFSSVLLDVLDGHSEEMPIFLLDATDQTDKSLLLVNLLPDELMTATTNANTASLGFYASYGESAPIVHIDIDIDQAIAFIVNQIVKIAIDVATEGGSTQILAAIPTINPLNIDIGIDTILKVIQVDPISRDAIEKFLDLNLNFQAADVDAIADAKISQKFTLSVDDMSYLITLEDGTSQAFKASDGTNLTIHNASTHDANHDGSIDYALNMVPTAMFSNDTELGLGVGYVLDFLKGSVGAGVKLPLGELLGIDVDWLTVEVPLVDVAVGPLLRVQGDLDLIDIDLFESRFSLDAGSSDYDGSVDLHLVGVNNAPA